MGTLGRRSPSSASRCGPTTADEDGEQARPARAHAPRAALVAGVVVLLPGSSVPEYLPAIDSSQPLGVKNRGPAHRRETPITLEAKYDKNDRKCIAQVLVLFLLDLTSQSLVVRLTTKDYQRASFGRLSRFCRDRCLISVSSSRALLARAREARTPAPRAFWAAGQSVPPLCK